MSPSGRSLPALHPRRLPRRPHSPRVYADDLALAFADLWADIVEVIATFDAWAPAPGLELGSSRWPPCGSSWRPNFQLMTRRLFRSSPGSLWRAVSAICVWSWGRGHGCPSGLGSRRRCCVERRMPPARVSPCGVRLRQFMYTFRRCQQSLTGVPWQSFPHDFLQGFGSIGFSSEPVDEQLVTAACRLAASTHVVACADALPELDMKTYLVHPLQFGHVT